MATASSLICRSLATRLRPCYKRALIVGNNGGSNLHFSRLSSQDSIRSDRDAGDDPSWNEMNEKTRSLANLLLDQDDSLIVQGSTTAAGKKDDDDDDQEQRKARASHVFNRRRGLSQAITMIESQKPTHQKQSNLLLTYLLGHENNHTRKSKSFRLGIAGPPGAGKSTFVEFFGKYLLNVPNGSCATNSNKDNHTSSSGEADDAQNSSRHKVAVVCIDPSSAVTGGSILGDKTRMTELSRHERAYVRPSPTKTVLGGLAAYTEDVVSLCQVAGYDFVIVETVGLGQSEIEVKESVDMLVLMVPPGGGDDLQGIKKGIVEVADMIVVTKADGSFVQAAKGTAADYSGALRMMPRSGLVSLKGWETPPVLLVSSHVKEGLEHVWDKICLFRRLMIESGELELKRQQQSRYWMWKNVHNLILEQTKNDPVLREKAQALELSLRDGKTTPRVAATELLESFVRH